jgi:hypothetical protein
MTDADFAKFEFTQDAIVDKYHLNEKKHAEIKEMRDRNLTEIQIKKNLRESMHDRKFGVMS